jgi:uncharacterized coiled-coil DUF342 family protein
VSDDDGAHAGADQHARAAELQKAHQALRLRRAEVAEHGARVHDEAARVHEQLDATLLDPDQLRTHADGDRQVAAQERADLARELRDEAERPD